MTELGRKLMLQEQRTNENREQYISERVQRIRDHLKKVESNSSRTTADETVLNKQLNLVEKLKKVQSSAEKSKNDFLNELKGKVSESIVKNEQSVISNKQRLRKEDRERITYLKQKARARDDSVREIKAAIAEDAEQRREIARLRKQDYEEFIARRHHLD